MQQITTHNGKITVRKENMASGYFEENCNISKNKKKLICQSYDPSIEDCALFDLVCIHNKTC